MVVTILAIIAAAVFLLPLAPEGPARWAAGAAVVVLSAGAVWLLRPARGKGRR
jgi:hypothetical protein